MNTESPSKGSKKRVNFSRHVLSRDPNNPEEDTFYLHFPHGVELVGDREFWLNHLSELLAEFLSHCNVRPSSLLSSDTK